MRKKRTLVQKGRKGLSIRKQCKLLGISGNAVYYKPKGERPENEEAMKKMDRFYMEHPTAGARTMRQHLLDEGLHLNLKRFGTPEIINSDQGSQYTSGLWAEACGNTMKVSMDGRGRAKDNIWIERFWRTIKREYIYLNPCDNAFELRKGIDNEIPERKYENNKLLIRTHEAA